MGRSTNPVIGRLGGRWRIRLSLALEAELQLKRGLIQIFVACFWMLQSSWRLCWLLAPECVWVLVHVTVCALVQVFACAIIETLFRFNIRTTDHNSESKCGISGWVLGQKLLFMLLWRCDQVWSDSFRRFNTAQLFKMQPNHIDLDWFTKY